MVFYRLTPVRSLARVLRRDCWSDSDLGVVVERPVLLDSLALCLVVDEDKERGGHIGPPLRVRMRSLANRQGSASGKRRAGCPGPPWRFPPDFYTRAGSISTAQGPPCGGRRLSNLCRNRFRTAPVLKPTCTHVQVRRQAIFSFGPGTAQPLAALPLTDAAYPLRVRPVFFLSRTKRKWGVESSGDHRILRPIRTSSRQHPDNRLKPYSSISNSACHRSIRASLGIRQSPRGESATVPTLGPSGTQFRLNCWEKNRR